MHVHVWSPDGEAKIWLEPEVELAVNKGLKQSEISELLTITKERIHEIKEAGESTSCVEVINISNHGIWLYIKGAEYFLPFEDFPWFKEAKVGEIMEVELFHDNHLRWEKLDIDLEIESLVEPDKYPLVYHN
jgi:hypothetical protein